MTLGPFLASDLGSKPAGGPDGLKAPFAPPEGGRRLTSRLKGFAGDQALPAGFTRRQAKTPISPIRRAPSGGTRSDARISAASIPPSSTVICSNATWIGFASRHAGPALPAPTSAQCSMEVQPCQSHRDRRSACFGNSAVGETRKLAAILVSDVVGYSRSTRADEDRILARAVLIAMAAVGVALLAQKAWRAVSSPVPANCALRSTVVPFASVC